MKNYFGNGMHKLFLIFALCLTLNGGFVLAQETTGNITGHVTDPGGASVVGAQVVITDTERGLQRTVQTTNEGTYSVTLLPSGTYTLTVERAGFKKYSQEGVVINVNDRRAIDVALETGQVTETVNVSGDAPLIQEGPTQRGLVDGTQVRQLPLNTRNFVQLATLSAGVTSALPSQVGFGALSTVSLSINGGRTSSVNYLVDGARNVDTGSNLTLLTVPSVDAISEFTVLTSNYAPEFGRNGGGVINVVTRGGTNNFHGTLYEFLRNDRFNAREPTQLTPLANLNTASGEQRFKAPLRYNDFGYTIGGPVFTPRFGEGGKSYNNGRDKTFFFFSQEFRRTRGFNTAVGTVASNEQRAGLFTNRIIDPQTNQPFVRNAAGQYVIPTSRFDPNAVAILNFIPTPNESL